MTPRELLERLEALGGINAKLLAKIRREVENPEKTVKPKSVVKFLLKKQEITKSRAAALVDEIESPKPVVHEEIAVVEQKNDYDTDDLTNTLREEIEEPPPKKLKKKPEPKVDAPDFDPAATVMDDGFSQPVDLVEVAQPLDPSFEVIPRAAAGFDADGNDAALDPFGGDPLGGQQQVDYGGGGAVEKETHGFKGKRASRDQWSTKWLFIGPAILGVLLMAGAILYYSLGYTSTEDQYKAVMGAFERNAWSDFLDKCKTFMEDHPKNEHFYDLKALQAQALLAQTYEKKQWDETIKRAKEFLPPLVEDENVKMADIRDDLSVTIPNSALEITRRAITQRNLEDIKDQLEKAVDAKAVADNVAYVTTTQRKEPRLAKIYAEMNDNILAAQGLIRKEDDYLRSIGEITRLSNQSKTDEAFADFQQLTQKYGDLGARAELQALMKTVSEKERELVSPIEAAIEVSMAEPQSPISKTVVLASKSGSPVEAHRGIISPVQTDGTLVGIDTGDGSLAWRRFLGYQTTIPWQAYDDDSIIVCNQQDNDVYRLKKRDGSIIWRARIGEPVVAPAINEAMVLVTTTSGKMIKLDPHTGNPTVAIQLPQGAGVSAMIADREPYIYQAGDYSNLYVLSSDDLSCKDVFYLGHDPGQIQVPPVSWTGLILVAINGSNYCDLHVLRTGEEGIESAQILTQQTTGPVTAPITKFGRWMLLAADTGHMSILQIDTTDENSPITEFASRIFDNPTGQRVYYHTKGSLLWTGGKGLTKYKLQSNNATLAQVTTVESNDIFVAPLERQDDSLLHVRKRSGSSMVSVSAVSADTLEEIWRSDIGGPLAGTPRMTDDSMVVVSGQGDVHQIDADAMQAGVSDRPIRASEILQNLSFDHVVNLDDGRGAAFGTGRADMLYYVLPDERELVQLRDPASNIVCKPVAAGDDVLIATASGQVMRLDPNTGQRVGSPFQPEVSPSEQVQWFEPAYLDESNIAIAKNSDSNGNWFYVLDISERESGINEVASLASEAKIKSRMQTAGGFIFAVVGGDEGDKLVSVNTGSGMKIAGEVAIPDDYVAGPWVVGNQILLRNRADQILAFDGQLNLAWKVDLPAGRLAGAPLIHDSIILLTLQSGKVLTVNPDDGSAEEAVDLGQPVVDGPVIAGPNLYFPGMDGTVHVVPAGGTP